MGSEVGDFNFVESRLLSYVCKLWQNMERLNVKIEEIRLKIDE